MIFILVSPVAFQQSCVYIFNEMVRDRETKMAESLKIMGLNKYMYALSFLIQRALWTTVTCLILALMTYYINSDFITVWMAVQLFFAIWFLGVSNLGLSLVVQNLFRDPKLATICAPFLLFLPTGVALLGIITPSTTGVANNWVQYFFWVPTFPFEVILADIFLVDGQPPFFETSAAIAWVVIVLLTPIYFYLHIYLSSVIPDSYGVTESCCFCLRKKRPIEIETEFESDE